MSRKLIYDLADEFEIPTSSVSEIIGPSCTKFEAIRALKQHIARHGNTLVSPLDTKNNKSSRSIGVLVPSIRDQIMFSMISGIEKWANEEGYSILIAHTQNKYNLEVSNTLSLLSSGVEGLIAFPSCETSQFDHFEMVTGTGLPVVLLEKVTSQFFLDEVAVDSYNSGFIPTEHLIDQGCKRIYAIVDGHTVAHNECTRGYQDALEANNIKYRENNLIVWSSPDLEDIFYTIERRLKSNCRPDGILCTNHLIAVKIMEIAKKFGIKIPHELAIVSFTDDHFSPATEPALSTVSFPAAEAGLIAAKQIQARTSLPDVVVASKKVILKTGITIRDSSLRNYVKKQKSS